jgi:hypothetical protein
MKTRCVATVLTFMLCNITFALTYMGPPTTTMKQGQVGIGLRSSWSENDLELDGLELDDIKIDTVLGSVHAGLASDRAEIYGLIGEQTNDKVMALGGGAVVTTNLDEVLSWGIRAQAIYWEVDAAAFGLEAEANTWDIQVTAGPCWRLDPLVVYGGPMLHLIRGDIDVTDGIETVSFDFQEQDMFGAYIGVGLQSDRQSEVSFELNITPGAIAGGFGVVCRF